jgi:UDP-hydrolysing UDP-N-acetyl-D-glucosamine 2-epimerase
LSARLGVLKTGRHDWGILQLLVEALKEAGVAVTVFEETGHTVGSASLVYDHIRATLAVYPLDGLILLGDRYETLMAAQAATVTKTPIIHLHGGEVTEGAFDDQIRYAITMLSQLHLVSSEDAKARLEALGRRDVHLIGAIGTDWAYHPGLATRAALEAELGGRLSNPIMLVCVHPETNGSVGVEDEAIRLGQENPGSTVYFLPNLDPGNEVIREKIVRAPRKNDYLVSILSPLYYWGLLKIAKKLVGNSSSAVLEAPAVNLESVIIGQRQKGRKPPSLLDGKATARAVEAISSWLRKRQAPLRGCS